ncbi:hypothetical protein WA026_013612 [Henosepilachna vigintioctopunctata]|uniref:Gustatory receptor n=1 Tax=Henosepilachna vigintioctopunctata TaxID=420089 RepID=A0AAW1VG85_9CUCU
MNFGDLTIYLCNILCIIPPITCRQSKSIKKVHHYWTGSVTVIVLILFCLTTYNRLLKVYNVMDPTISFLDQLSETSFTLTNLLTSVEVTFFSRSFQDFFRKLSYNGSPSNWIDCLNRGKFFMAFNLGLLVTIGLDMTYWSRTVGIGTYILYSLRAFQFYQNGLNIYLLVCFLNCLKLQLKLYKRKLTKYVENSRVIESNLFTPNQNASVEDLNELRKKQCELLNLVPHFNRVFGRNILLIMFNCIVVAILFTSIALVCIMKKMDFQGIQPDTCFYLLCSAWITQSLTFPIMLAYACEAVVTEADKILSLSIDYLNDFPVIPKTSELQIVKEELQMICQQAQAKRPVFSAGGFFVVNYTMLGMMIGSVTSYIIVVLQFVK